MSAPIKPKSGGVNLSLTEENLTHLEFCIGLAAVLFPADYNDKSRDILAKLHSQSKESSNDS